MRDLWQILHPRMTKQQIRSKMCNFFENKKKERMTVYKSTHVVAWDVLFEALGHLLTGQSRVRMYTRRSVRTFFKLRDGIENRRSEEIYLKRKRNSDNAGKISQKTRSMI